MPIPNRYKSTARAKIWDNLDSLNAGSIQTYERHVQVPPILSGKTANQPTPEDNFTAGGLLFDTGPATQYTFLQWEIPDDWDSISDIIIEIDWYPTTAMTGSDTIKWDMEYRSIEELEGVNNGTAVTASYTELAPRSQWQFKHSPIIFYYDNVNQPLTRQDHLFVKVSRDIGVANDFAGDVVITEFEIIYNSIAVPTSN